MSNEIKKCPDDRCAYGADYWSVVQFCGQDKLWMHPETARVVMAFEDLICYCECTPGKKYCYKPNCVDNMVNVMNQCTIMQLTYKEFVSLPRLDPDPCDCPCPYKECDYCSDPDVKEYVSETCKTDGWWAGYPIVMSGGGGQFCTCLCPDEVAMAMTAKTPEGYDKPLAEFKTGDSVLAAGRDLNWRPCTIKTVARNQSYTPFPAVRIKAEGRSITLAGDQMVLAGNLKLAPAIALSVGDRILAADRETATIEAVEKLDIYAAPLTFLGLSDAPPDKDLSTGLLNINGFAVADYATQVFYTVDLLHPELISGKPY